VSEYARQFVKMKYTVYLIESEPEWGQRLDDIKIFDNKAEAEEFVRKFNLSNKEPERSPNRIWYMYATEPVVTIVDELESCPT